MALSGIKLNVDYSGVISALGAAEAMLESVNDPIYTNDLMKVAHGVAENEFNILAAAKASTGAISHMYEWGTQGINRGRSNVRPNPMSPRARLWEDVLVTQGLRGTMGFIYKPSIATVPKPTVQSTGMDPKIIEKMSDHVFTWKARVMELGETVHIVPKNAKALLIPLRNGATPRSSDGTAGSRGYVMSPGPINVRPGARVAGNFSQFWVNFWETVGQATMEASVVEQIKADFEPAIKKPVKGVPRPASTQKVTAAIKKRSEEVKAEAKGKAKTRSKKKKTNDK